MISRTNDNVKKLSSTGKYFEKLVDALNYKYDLGTFTDIKIASIIDNMYANMKPYCINVDMLGKGCKVEDVEKAVEVLNNYGYNCIISSDFVLNNIDQYYDLALGEYVETVITPTKKDWDKMLEAIHR